MPSCSPVRDLRRLRDLTGSLDPSRTLEVAARRQVDLGFAARDAAWLRAPGARLCYRPALNGLAEIVEPDRITRLKGMKP